MAPDHSWRARLRTTVLEASTPSGRAYNVVVFGAILVSVLALMLEPDPFGNSALRQTDVVWIDLVQNICLGIFAADFVLHLFVSERPLKYLFSFYGLIDFTAVLFFFIPQVRSEILLWVFKFGRILRVFKLLRFIDEARMLGRALRGVLAPSAFICFSSSCSRWCWGTASLSLRARRLTRSSRRFPMGCIGRS